MKSDDKSVALIFVWIAYGVISFFTFSGKPIDFWTVIFAAVLGVIALAATFIIARMGSLESGFRTLNAEDKDRTDDKAKRSDLALVERLIASMSEGEKATLRRELLGDSTSDVMVLGEDGELMRVDEQQAAQNERLRRQ